MTKPKHIKIVKPTKPNTDTSTRTMGPGGGDGCIPVR